MNFRYVLLRLYPICQFEQFVTLHYDADYLEQTYIINKTFYYLQRDMICQLQISTHNFRDMYDHFRKLVQIVNKLQRDNFRNFKNKLEIRQVAMQTF